MVLFREMRQGMRTSGLVSIDLPLLLEPYSEMVSCVTKLSIPGMIDWQTIFLPMKLTTQVASV